MDDRQRCLSVVLNQLKKKDLAGLLAAQRNGTIDDFVKPHLDAYMEKEARKSLPISTATSGGEAKPVVKQQARLLFYYYIEFIVLLFNKLFCFLLRPFSERSPSSGKGGSASFNSPQSITKQNSDLSPGLVVLNPRDTQIFQVFHGIIRPEYLKTIRTNGLNTNCSYILTDPGK